MYRTRAGAEQSTMKLTPPKITPIYMFGRHKLILTKEYIKEVKAYLKSRSLV